MPLVRVSDSGKEKKDNKILGVVSGVVSVSTIPLCALGWLGIDIAVYVCVLSTSVLCAYNSYDS